MSSFVNIAGWAQHKGTHSAPRSFGHIRSLSSISQISAFKSSKIPPKSTSTSELPIMAAEAATHCPTRMPSSRSAYSHDDEHDLSTIPDPRSRAMSPAIVDGAASPAHHPELSDEVATLSTKLINAINLQTNLDDTLSHTRMDLDAAHQRIRQLEEQNAQQRELLAGDVWVRRKTAESEKTQLLSRVADEKRSRQETEQQKKKIEQELENLTAALFEEANKMVIQAKEEARKEQDALHRRNDLLREQVADTEGLVRSLQEQLGELKHVMEQMGEERDDQAAVTAPSSPGFARFDGKDEDGLVSDGALPTEPSYPTSFTHLLQPVLRTDLAAYEDFVELAKTSKRLSMRSSSSSRPSSGTQLSFAALGLSLGASHHAATGSTSSLSTVGTPISAPGSSPQTPNTPATTISNASAASVIPLPPLKETRFYKRVLAEDIEPTLRLDTAPGLSWLARRGVLTAMTDGALVVEPVPTTGATVQTAKPQHYPCSLCGENRRDEEHLREHRFRIDESDSARRYPLCRYCLHRVRSTCDFLGFLRIVKDGHRRADDEDAEKAAWEESVRLREQMFWSRIGGGVLPTSGSGSRGNASAPPSVGAKSPRISQEEAAVRAGQEQEAADGQSGVDGVDRQDHATTQVDGAAEEVTVSGEATAAPSTPPSNRNSAQSLGAGSEREGSKRLSLQIPGFP